MSRLTSLANVKRFLALTTTGQDALIDRMIPTESAVIERYIGRKFGFTTAVSKRLNGTGTDTIVVPDQPIVSVVGLTVCGAALTLSPDGQAAGFVFDDTSISLVGGAKFPQGVQNVAAVWSAGYQATENVVVPAPAANATTVSVSPFDMGFPMAANSVAYAANGALLTLSTAANGPLVGQFSFADGSFTFNAADANQTVTLVFPYAPSDIEEACIEMVALDLRQRDNLGISSKSLAGESVSYTKAGMDSGTKAMLQPYKRVAPG